VLVCGRPRMKAGQWRRKGRGNVGEGHVFFFNQVCSSEGGGGGPVGWRPRCWVVGPVMRECVMGNGQRGGQWRRMCVGKVGMFAL